MKYDAEEVENEAMKLFESMHFCLSEQDVASQWRSILERSFPGCYPFRSLFSGSGIKHDGILEHVKLQLKILAEFKFKVDISVREYLLRCLVQILVYLKRIEKICDRLIHDLERRRKGEFYTPTYLVDEAHKEIEKVLGSDWKERCVVWDPAWGTGNLTRDYEFRELYCSDINKDAMSIGSRYNTNAVKFVYDFLNDDVSPFGVETFGEYKLRVLAPGLVKAFEENREIVIFMNPPYSSEGNVAINLDNQGKKAVSSTNIKNHMKNMGKASLQLYSQFIYRILMLKSKYKLTNISMCLFSKTSFLQSMSFEKLRRTILVNFKFESGFMFNSRNFSSVSQWWPVIFSVFTSNSSGHIGDERFRYRVLRNEGCDLVYDGDILLYSISKDENLQRWVTLDRNPSDLDKYNFISTGPLKLQ